MAFVHGKQSRVLADALHLSGFLSSWDLSSEVELADVTTHLDEGHRWLPGLETGTLSLSGHFDADSAAGGQHAVLSAARGAADASVITMAPSGLATGERVVSMDSRESTYSTSAPVAGKVSFSATWQAEGRIDFGVALHDLVAETATGSGTSVDNGASTAAGGVGALHVTAFSGLTSLDVAVQHSADAMTWVDLVTFTQATGTTQDRVAVTGTVDQHVRAQWTTSGTGSATFAVALARR